MSLCLWYLHISVVISRLYTLHRSSAGHWTPVSGREGREEQREEGGKRNQFRAGDLLSADLSNTQTLDPPHPEKTLVSLPAPPRAAIGPASIAAWLWLVTQALTSLGWRQVRPSPGSVCWWRRSQARDLETQPSLVNRAGRRAVTENVVITSTSTDMQLQWSEPTIGQLVSTRPNRELIEWLQFSSRWLNTQKPTEEEELGRQKAFLCN